MSELTNKCQSLEGSLGAVRTEADALRDQLRLQKLATATGQPYSLDHPNNELDWSAILMQVADFLILFSPLLFWTAINFSVAKYSPSS